MQTPRWKTNSSTEIYLCLFSSSSMNGMKTNQAKSLVRVGIAHSNGCQWALSTSMPAMHDKHLHSKLSQVNGKTILRLSIYSPQFQFFFLVLFFFNLHLQFEYFRLCHSEYLVQLSNYTRSCIICLVIVIASTSRSHVTYTSTHSVHIDMALRCRWRVRCDDVAYRFIFQHANPTIEYAFRVEMHADLNGAVGGCIEWPFEEWPIMAFVMMLGCLVHRPCMNDFVTMYDGTGHRCTASCARCSCCCDRCCHRCWPFGGRRWWRGCRQQRWWWWCAETRFHCRRCNENESKYIKLNFELYVAHITAILCMINMNFLIVFHH